VLSVSRVSCLVFQTVTADAASAADCGASKEVRGESQTPAPAPAPAPDKPEEDPLPTGWKEYKNPEGRPYFHNKDLGSTVWSRPRLSKAEKERLKLQTKDSALAAFLDSV